MMKLSIGQSIYKLDISTEKGEPLRIVEFVVKEVIERESFGSTNVSYEYLVQSMHTQATLMVLDSWVDSEDRNYKQNTYFSSLLAVEKFAKSHWKGLSHSLMTQLKNVEQEVLRFDDIRSKVEHSGLHYPSIIENCLEVLATKDHFDGEGDFYLEFSYLFLHKNFSTEIKLVRFDFISSADVVPNNFSSTYINRSKEELPYRIYEFSDFLDSYDDDYALNLDKQLRFFYDLQDFKGFVAYQYFKLDDIELTVDSFVEKMIAVHALKQSMLLSIQFHLKKLVEFHSKDFSIGVLDYHLSE